MAQITTLTTDSSPDTTGVLYTYRSSTDYKISISSLFGLYTSSDHFTIQPSSSSQVPLIVKGAASQSANLLNVSTTASFNSSGLLSKYNGTTLAGLGVPYMVASGSITSGTTILTYTPGSDGTFRINYYVTIKSRSAGAIQVTATYTDQNGTSRTAYPYVTTAATSAAINTSVTNVNGYLGMSACFRAKAANAITVATTSVTGTWAIFAYLEQIM